MILTFPRLEEWALFWDEFCQYIRIKLEGEPV